MNKNVVAQGGEDLLAIAHVARPHGVQGEVSAIPLVPPMLDPDELIAERDVIVRDARGKTAVRRGEWVRPHQERWLVKLAGIDDMTAADTLRGCDLCLRRADLPELPENWYYEADLVGCQVVDVRLGELGVVTGLEMGYVQPQLKVKLKRAEGREVLVPWRNALFPEVDLAGRVIRSELPVGIPGIEDEATDQA